MQGGEYWLVRHQRR